MKIYEKSKKTILDGCFNCGSENLEFHEVNNMTSIVCVHCVSTIKITHNQFLKEYENWIRKKSNQLRILNQVNKFQN